MPLRTVTLTFPMPVNVANARLHWRAKVRKHDAWKMLAIVQERGLRGRPAMMQRVRVTAVLYVGQENWRMDADNASARLKWCLDLLQERGLIVDDDPAHLTLIGPEQRVGGKRRVELTLEEVA